MAAHPLISKIVDAGIGLAYSGKGAGIAGVWAEFLRQHIRVVEGPKAKTKTWMVDGAAVWINAEFTAPMSGDELQFLIAHETLHIALDHIELTRAMGCKTPEEIHLSNVAQDAIINQALVDDNVGKMPKCGVKLADFIAQGYSGPRDSVAVYEWLQQNPKKAPPQPKGGADGEQGEGQALAGCSPSGMPGDEPTPGEGNQPGEGQGTPGQGPASGADQLKQKIRSERARATLKEASRSAGSGTAIAELLAPRPIRCSVRDLIRQGFEKASVTALNRVIPTYSRAGRRSVDDLVTTPGKMGTEARVAFAGDVSGSMTDEGKRLLIGMIEKTSKEFPSVRVFLVTHTDEVTFADWLKAGGDLSKAKQATAFSGGTDFKPAYDAVAKAGAKFDVLVHFTDGFNAGPWPECPARQLVVGLWGSGHGATPMPAGAKVIPVADVEADR